MELRRYFSTFWYYFHQYWIDVSDPRTKDYFMVSGGAWKIITVLAGYWLLVKRILPWYMKNRRPYHLKTVILAYNAMMVILNATFFFTLLGHLQYGRLFLDFKYPDRNDRRPETLHQLRMAWLGYLSRFLDMFDTIFFVLRKKHNQVSFLHVYHHMVVPFLGWFSFKLNPLLPIIALFALFNTIIHVLMYSYYSLAMLGPWMQKYLWWKRYLTQLQLLQFAICGLYGLVLFIRQTDYPMIWFVAAVGQNPIFFYMFYDFYRKSYRQQQAKFEKDNQSFSNLQQQQQQPNGVTNVNNNHSKKAD